jgi:SPOR domain
MGQLLRSLAVVAVLLVGAPPLAAFQGPVQTPSGPKKAPAKPAEQKPAEQKPAEQKAAEQKGNPSPPKDDKAVQATQRMLDTGVAAYEAGKLTEAFRAFDTAIHSGGLKSQQLAKALYYRGLTYRKRGKPSLAIPDLTSAIWLKDGLSATDRQEAMSVRAEAYRDAGVGDVPGVSETATAASAVPDGWQTAMSGSRAASSPAPAPAASSAPPQPSVPVSAPQMAAYEPASPPTPPKTSSSSGSGGGFFSSITSLFGGSSSSSSSDDVTTSSIPAAPAPAISAWSQTTEVATPAPESAPAAARPAPPPPTQQAALAPSEHFATQTQVTAVAPPMTEPPKTTAAPTGKFHVQVATVRSRSEAYALAVRLVSQHSSQMGSRRPQVDKTVIGSMGTFYRVSVGPYASAEESKQLCGSLRTNGYDCLVITE